MNQFSVNSSHLKPGRIKGRRQYERFYSFFFFGYVCIYRYCGAESGAAMAEIKAIDAFRRQFAGNRINQIAAAVLTFDEACLLMHDERALTDVVVTDTFQMVVLMVRLHFIAGVSPVWWA